LTVISAPAQGTTVTVEVAIPDRVRADGTRKGVLVRPFGSESQWLDGRSK
jgi:hypothetical protein